MGENIKYFALVTELVGLMIGFAYLGEWLEKKFELGRYGMLSGVIFAIVIWFIHAIVVMKSLEKSSEDGDRKEN
ncbi:MAG: AtpZ/AtpI family protein [Bdellovibrionales bacterium]